MKKLDSKSLVFAAMMAALGNVLSFLSIQLAPLMPNIPLGPVQMSLALDLSHLTTFIAALYGGPVVGGLTGLLGGLIAAFEFGFSKGNLITGFGLPLGKAMTGVAAGLVMSRFDVNESRVRPVLATVISYIPEAVFTVFLFVSLFPVFLGLPPVVATAIATQIIIKAFFEMVVMGIVLAGMIENQGFTHYVSAAFQ